MTLYEFLRLEDNDKYQTTWDLEAHIDSIINDEHRITRM